MLDPLLIVRLNNLVDILIGDKDEAQRTNKTAFERSSRAQNIEGCPRAYNLATSYERPRKTHGPTVSAKVTEEWGTDPWLLFRKDFLEVFLIQN